MKNSASKKHLMITIGTALALPLQGSPRYLGLLGPGTKVLLFSPFPLWQETVPLLLAESEDKGRTVEHGGLYQVKEEGNQLRKVK